MSVKKLQKSLKKIREKLARYGPCESVEAEIACLCGIVKSYKVLLEYEKTKASYPDVRVRRIEPLAAVSEKDRKNLDKAIAASRQIRKRLGEIKIARLSVKSSRPTKNRFVHA